MILTFRGSRWAKLFQSAQILAIEIAQTTKTIRIMGTAAAEVYKNIIASGWFNVDQAGMENGVLVLRGQPLNAELSKNLDEKRARAFSLSQ